MGLRAIIQASHWNCIESGRLRHWKRRPCWV